MGVRSFAGPAGIAAAIVVSLIAMQPSLAASQSAGFTIRITRPVTAAVLIERDPFTGASALSGSISASGAAGAESFVLRNVSDLESARFLDDRMVALEAMVPAGFDVVATAS
jgi:hypothetical protein